MVEMKDIVDKLAKLTEQGQVRWRPTVDKSTFAATFGRMSVLITTKGPSERDDLLTYRLAVLDEKGNEIDYATHGPLVGPASFPILVSLYTSAKRTALGADERLEELMNEMDRVSGS